MKRVNPVYPLLAAAALLTAGCSAAVGPDQAGVEYNGGVIQATKFTNCAKTGTREYRGPGDHIYLYPAGQRSYEFSDKKDSADTGPISVVSKDNLQMDVSGVATFSLNTDCDTLRRFHEQIGIKYKAYTDAGWLKMLGTYLRQPLDRAMDQAAKKYPWKDLYSNPAVKRQWEQEVGQQVVAQVNATAGGQFFCAPSFTGKGQCGSFNLTLQQPQPPQNVRNALAQAQEAAEQAEAQKNRNVQVRTELDAIRDLVKVLGPDGYVLYQAIKDGRITVVPVPQGGNLNITPGNSPR